MIHLKGLTCFVAHLGGRPSPAVQLDSRATSRWSRRARRRSATSGSRPGDPDGRTPGVPGREPSASAVGLEDCSDPILFDFGPGSDAYFVYTRGRPMPKSRVAADDRMPMAHTPPGPPSARPRASTPSSVQPLGRGLRRLRGRPTNINQIPHGRGHAAPGAPARRPARRPAPRHDRSRTRRSTSHRRRRPHASPRRDAAAAARTPAPADAVGSDAAARPADERRSRA